MDSNQRYNSAGDSTSSSRLVLREKGSAFPHKQARSVVASKRFVRFVAPGRSSLPLVFVHVPAVQRAGLHNLSEGQKIKFEILADRRTGKSSAGNLRAA